MHPCYAVLLENEYLSYNFLYQVLQTADSGDEKAITAMGLLNTLQTILNVMEEKPEVNYCVGGEYLGMGIPIAYLPLIFQTDVNPIATSF